MSSIRIFSLFFFLAEAFISGNTLAQVVPKEIITVYRDVVYSVVDGQELRLDIAVPDNLKAPAPAIMDIPGGAWREINKSAEDAVFYATFGFIGVSITHRSSKVAVFPAAVHDCKTAIRWLRAHADKYRIDPDKIGVTGFSSGGHLAVLLGTSGGDEYLEGQGGYAEYSSRIQAVVDHFGPTDFLKMNDSDMPDSMDHFTAESPESLFLGGTLQEKKEAARLANPIEYIDADDPPTLIGHGEQDGMVIINQSELLFDAMKRAGVPAEFIRVKNAGHMYRPYKWDVEISPTVAEINQKMIQWFQKWLGQPELDMERIKSLESKSKISPPIPTPLFYRLTIDLPGKTEDSYCRGRFRVQCEGKVLVQGEIRSDDLSTEEGRAIQQELILSGVDLNGKVIMWNFRGEIFDSSLNETYNPMFMQGEKYDPSIKGIGYFIFIDKEGHFQIEKRVYKDEQ